MSRMLTKYSSDDDLRDLHVLGILPSRVGRRGALAERQQAWLREALHAARRERDGRDRRCGPKRLECNLRETL